MDPTNRTLDSMITVPHPSQLGDFVESTMETQDRPSKRRAIEAEADLELEEEDGNLDANTSWKKGVVIPESECEFTSILELRREVARGNEGKFASKL
jgi:hypothetical protein